MNISRLLFFFLIVACFSCEERKEVSFHKGRLEELVLGEYSIEQDSVTEYFSNFRTWEYNGEEFLAYHSNSPKYKGGSAVTLLDFTSKKVVSRWDIPVEGPQAMKSYPSVRIPLSRDTLLALNSKGDLAFYDTLGNKIIERQTGADYPSSKEEYIQFFSHKGLAFVDNEKIYAGLNPFNPYQESAPIGFSNWMVSIGIQTGKQEQSVFRMPSGYGDFLDDLAAYQVFGAYDRLRKELWFGFPYADSLVLLKDLNETKRIRPATDLSFNYTASELRDYGNFKVWLQPKEASMHLGLMHDPFRDCFLLISKLKESGDGDTPFDREKHYVLRVYNSDWSPLGEYSFEYEGREEFSEWFVNRSGLYINSASQELEDEYMFTFIDLSRFEGN